MGPLHSFCGVSQVLTQVLTSHVSQPLPIPGQFGEGGMIPHPKHMLVPPMGETQTPVAEQPEEAVHVVAHTLPSAAHP